VSKLLLIAVLLAGAASAQENWSYSDSLGYTVDVVLPYALPASCENCIIEPSYWSVDNSTTWASNAPNTGGVFDFFSNAQGEVTSVHFVVADGSTLLASVGAGSSLPAGDSYIAPGVDLQGATGVWVDPPLAAPELEFHDTVTMVSLSLLLCFVAIVAGRRT
jgi:hypothetical protein